MKSTPFWIGAISCIIAYVISWAHGSQEPIFIATCFILSALGGAVGD